MDKNIVLFVLFVMIYLLIGYLWFLLYKKNKAVKELQKKYGSGIPNSAEEDPIVNDILNKVDKLSIAQRERVIHRCFNLPAINIVKVVTKEHSWILAGYLHKPEETSMAEDVVNQALREQTG